MSAHDKILAAASENVRILKALAEVDYAPSALKQHAVYMADLSREISRTDAAIQSLEDQLNAQRKEHEKYRDSTLRRFAYKVGGKKEKFESRAEKEEREYVDALNTELKVKARRELLTTQWEAAQDTKKEMEGAAKDRIRLQQELDTLYNSVFTGPTPEFPEEDAKESEVKQATVVFEQRQRILKAETEAIKLLAQADQVMLGALNELAHALRSSQYDIYGFGGSFADYSERSALSRAQVGVSNVEMLLEQARRVQPEIQSIGPMSIASGNLVGDILFDNVFSDINFHKKIEASGRELRDATHRLQEELASAKEREKVVRSDLAEVTRDLNSSRKDLYRIRQETLASVLGNGGAPQPSTSTDSSFNARPPSYEDSPAPPSYTAE